MGMLTKRKIEYREDFAFGMIVGIVVLAVVVMVGLGVTMGSMERIDDSYFVSDGTKLVLSMDREVASYEEGDFEPELTHLVYYYRGNTVNDVKIFYQYENKEMAAEADRRLSLDERDWAVKKKLNGKYLIFDLASSQYDKMTTNEVKESILSMKAAGGAVD